MKPKILYNGIAHFFMLFFLYTAIAKFFEMGSFRQTLTSLQFISGLAGVISWSLAFLEIVIVSMLFAPQWRLSGLWSSAIVMSLFTLYLFGVYFIDDHLFRSFGGILEDLSLKQHIIFNIACIILASIGIYAGRNEKQIILPKFGWTATTLSIFLLSFIAWIILTAEKTPPIIKTGFEGSILPSFDIVLPDSVTHFNTNDIPMGKPFVIIAFSPYCPHCKGEIADIEKNMERFADIHFYLITSFSLSDLKPFYERMRLNKYPSITVGSDEKNIFLPHFKWHMVPYTTIYDAKKRLAQVIPGRVDITMLTRCVNN